MNRKLIRPDLSDIKEQLPSKAYRARKPVPPEQTSAEAFYYKKQMDNRTKMVIVLKDGVYTTTAPIGVDRQGAAGKPIRIAAKTPGGVTIAGADGFDVAGTAAYVEIDGFLLKHQSGKTQVRSGATHIRFTHDIFECVGDGAYLTIAGDDTEVDRNEFRNKKTLGNMIDVRGTGSQVAQRVWIHHNYFHDFANAGGNGAETIRFGHSELSLSKGLGLIEHNLFVRCTGENELITNKSGANTYRYNTFLDSPGAQLTLRHGNDCLVYGNTFRRTDGDTRKGENERGGEQQEQLGHGVGSVLRQHRSALPTSRSS